MEDDSHLSSHSMNTNTRFALTLDRFLQNLESCTRVRFAVRDFSEFTRGELPVARFSHTCTYCRYIKSDPKRDERCFFQDVTLAYSTCAQADQPVLRYCHAGVCEALVPIRELPNGQLHGVIFCGQVRTRKSRLITKSERIQNSLVRKTEQELLAVAGVVHEYCKANAHVVGALVEARKFSVEPGDLVQRALLIMKQKFREEIDLGHVAKAVCISPSRLAHLIKDMTGRSFTDNLRSIRMGEAHQLLASTDLKVHVVARTVGIEDAGYFHRLFKRLNGETPLEFRDRIRANRPKPEA